VDLHSYFKFIALELEGKGKKDNLFGVKKSSDKETFEKIYKLINTRVMDKETKIKTASELKETLINFYTNKYAQSNAELIPEPLRYYYFDFWLNSENQAITLIQKSLNKFMFSGITEYGKFDNKTLASLKEMNNKLVSTETLYKMILYFNTKRCFFHISLSDRRYRINWIVRVLKLQTYITTNYN